MIRIVIADDHAIVREGLRQIIAASPAFEVIDEAADGDQVMQLVRERDFDLLLLDLSMPGRFGIELIKLVRAERPKLRILVLSMHQERQYAVRAIKAGANGYLSKDSAPAQILQALGKVANGGAVISTEVAEQLALSVMPGSAVAAHETLSQREFQVLCMLAEGLSVSDVASRLSLSPKTASTHKTNLMQKMGLRNASELVRYALKNGLINASDP